MILLDSNIIIGYLNGDSRVVEALDALKRDRRALFVSSISVAETLALPDASGEALGAIERFLEEFITIDPDVRVAKLAAKLRRERRLDIPDAFVAATALVHGIPLATRDKKVRQVPGLVVADF